MSGAEERVLVCAPTGRDGPLTAEALRRGGLQAEVCATAEALCEAARAGVGAALLTEEALSPAGLEAVARLRAAQPAWSDLPVVLLTRDGWRGPLAPLEGRLAELGNVTLLDRPAHPATLLVMVRAALRARRRQYEARAVLERVQAQAEALRRAADERGRLLDSEREARHSAERATRTKDEFLAVVSHELRTPLAAILGWVQLLQDQPAGGRFDRGVEVIGRNARAQARLIEDLLDVSRIISGKLKLQDDRVDPSAVVLAAVEAVRLAAEAKGVAVELELDRAAGPLRGDAGRLQQVAWNLLQNAIKFTPAGGRVRVRLAREGACALLEVADDGRGIDPAFLPYVFDRFRQAENPTTRSAGGLGLGLAICRHLVEQHGGAIEVRSEGAGRGATFRVRLPLSPDAVLAPAPSPAPAEGLAGLSVVLVDDDDDAREVLRLQLERQRVRVRPAASAAEALALLEQERPALLISDIGMPGEDGYALIRRVRARPARDGGDVPAIALTAFARSEDQDHALRAGFQLHLPKPVEPHALAQAIASLVKPAGG